MDSETVETLRGSVLGLKEGEVINGRFHVGKLIGVGGQGVVLEAKHLEWDRTLALKIPLPEVVQSPQNRERFLKEAESWIRLGVHPSIVRCWFVYQVSDLPALFLDLVKGGSLEDLLKGKSFQNSSWEKPLQIMLQLAEGLAHAHSMGMVHRDIKPENILVRGDGSVCLTDFGLVKTVKNPERSNTSGESEMTNLDDTSVTATGVFVGSPRYGAPEQWSPDTEITPATDLYALGGVFYEMLCGRRAFDSSEESPNVLVLIHRHLSHEPPDPREFREDIPEPLARLALQCLAKDPGERPGSAKDLIKILARQLQEIGQKAYHPPRPVPGGDRADLLNNAAVSLFSLDKVPESRELLQKGLLLEAGHPECLYNLVQLDRRAARISGGDSLRQLRRANAKYEMALLCIEEGLGQQARSLLDAIPESEKTGLIYRIQGDALMYAKQYPAAERAYSEAQRTMPYDPSTALRKQLAMSRTNAKEGDIYFPASESCYHYKAQTPGNRVFLSPESDMLLECDGRDFRTISFKDGASGKTFPCPPGTVWPQNPHWAGGLVLFHGEREVSTVGLASTDILFRRRGSLLAANRDLDRLLIRDGDQVALVNLKQGEEHPLAFPKKAPPDKYVKAAFSPSGEGVCILTSTGRLAQIQENYKVSILAWPPALPRFREIQCFELSSRWLVYTATTGGSLSAIDIGAQKLRFSLRLPFTPDRLITDATGRTVVVSAEVQFGVLKSNGKVLLRGDGPFAVDSTRRFGLTWCEGYLMLYNLYPFRRLRTWTEKIEKPVRIEFAWDGRKAITVGSDGQCLVWEVDEDHRVFERNLLLTPGASYSELNDSFDSFLKLMSQAQRLYNEERYYQAYVSVRKARSEPGFFQAPDALALHWRLCENLQRSGLEAIWERLYLTKIVGCSLSDGGTSVLVARRDLWGIRDFGNAAGTVRIRVPVEARIVKAYYLGLHEDMPYVLLICADGSFRRYRASDGKLLEKGEVGLSPIRGARRVGDSVLVLSPDRVGAFFSLREMRKTSTFDLSAHPMERLFVLPEDKILTLNSVGSEVIDFKTGEQTTGPPVPLPGNLGRLTFADHLEGRDFFVGGFEHGGLAVVNAKDGESLFVTSPLKGAVTGVKFNFDLAFGVAVSERGELAVFDLNSQYVFERFTAHTEPIKTLHLCPLGRYAATITLGGQLRFWELSWELTEQVGEQSVDWLPPSTEAPFSRLGKLFKFT